ncbi:MAG: DUF1499 domain-containing protein [Myxococcota bacterium]
MVRNTASDRFRPAAGLAFAVLAGACLLLAGCGGRMPRALADGTARLAPCPASPNCVSSEATDEIHAIAPLRIRGDAAAAWQGLADHLAKLPRVEVVKTDGDYLHAVFTTRLMRYQDDVELALDRAAGTIRVRSASRVGYGDMGANRARVEAIRAALAAQGLVEPADASTR